MQVIFFCNKKQARQPGKMPGFKIEFKILYTFKGTGIPVYIIPKKDNCFSWKKIILVIFKVKMDRQPGKKPRFSETGNE